MTTRNNVNPMLLRRVSFSASIAVLTLLSACTSQPVKSQGVKDQPGATSANAGGKEDPYPGVNTVAKDRDMWMQLLSDHTKIYRTVVYTPTGVEATTQSDDPVVAARIIEHAHAMKARMDTGAVVRIWDPVFADLFKNYAKVTLSVTTIEKGVKVVESSDDPETTSLLWSHAAGVSEFIRHGRPINGRETPRIKAGSTPPTAEVALGGIKHRFLLTQPDAAQVAQLPAYGVNTIINYRTPGEHPTYDEAAAAASAGLTYSNLPYKGAAELSDDFFSKARASIGEVEAKGQSAALHCRTGNRVGPGWAAYRAIDQGIPVEQAIKEAKEVGMRDAGLEAAARAYIARHKPATAN